MSETFTVGGFQYSCQPLNVFQQLDIVRKWGTVLVWVSQADPDKVTPAGFAKAFAVASAPIAKEDYDLALITCLGSVRREVGGDKGWAQVCPQGIVMFEDIRLPHMLELLYHVLRLNGVFDFFSDAPATSGPPKAAG